MMLCSIFTNKPINSFQLNNMSFYLYKKVMTSEYNFDKDTQPVI